MTQQGRTRLLDDLVDTLGSLIDRLRSLPRVMLYSISFVFVAYLGFGPLIDGGQVPICLIDGVARFNDFADLGQTLRAAFSRALAGEGLALPAYDLSMGYGHPASYPGDPLMYLSALFPLEYAEVGFVACIFAKLWLAGLAFMPLARRLGISRGWTVLSALVYAFSSWGLHSFLQFGFLNFPIWFALVVWGAVVLLQDGRPYAYIATSAGACVATGIYCLYMMQLMVAVFVATRLVVFKARPRDWLSTLLRFLGALMVVFIVCAPWVVPTLKTLVSLDRVTADFNNPDLYTIDYYEALLSGFVGLYHAERDWFFGYGALALVCCIALFAIRGNQSATVAKLLLIIATVFVCVPFFGSMFNGFAYVTNRWTFGYALLVACIVGMTGPRCLTMTRRQLLVVGGTLFLYNVAIVVLPYARYLPSMVQMLFTWLLFACMVRASRFGRAAVVMEPRKTDEVVGSGDDAPVALRIQNDAATGAYPQISMIHPLLQGAIAGIAIVALGMNYSMFLLPLGQGWQETLIGTGEALGRAATATPAGVVAESGHNELSRMDHAYAMDSGVMTYGLLASCLLDVYGIDFYSPLYNNDVDLFHRELALMDTGEPNWYASLDGRAALMRALGVRFYARPNYDTLPNPYGYSSSVGSSRGLNGRTYTILEDTNHSLMAIGYEHAISRSLFDDLNPLERQEAMLQGVVLADDKLEATNVSGKKNRDDITLTSFDVPFDILTADEGISFQEGMVRVRKAKASMELTCEKAPGTELYLYVEHMAFNEFNERECYDDDEWTALSEERQQELLARDMIWTPSGGCAITVETDYSSGAFTCPTADGHLYGGHDTWLWNAGYSEVGSQRIKLTFELPGEYAFDDFRVLAQPMKTFDRVKEQHGRVRVANLLHGVDTISCDVSSERDGYLFLSVPYAPEWTATIDGMEVEVLRADSAFMAIRLPEGGGHVTFTYVKHDGWQFAVGIVTGVLVLLSYVAGRGGELPTWCGTRLVLGDGP